MRADQAASGSIDAYIAGFPPDIRDILERIRSIVRAAAPDAQETIKYQMPTFTLQGNLVHFAAFKNHIGLYPTPTGIETFRAELAPYESGKGSIRFPLDQPIPYALIGEIVKFRVQENMDRAAARKRGSRKL